MGYVVVHKDGMTTNAEMEPYLRLLNQILLKRGVDFAKLPRVQGPEKDNRWLYVWPTANEAQDFARKLNKSSTTPHWMVQPVDAHPSLGPLRPIEVQVGRQRNGWTFALAPWARRAIQWKYPDSCRSTTVFVASEVRSSFQDTHGELSNLVEQMLLVLTGLKLEQLEVFGDYTLVDPVTSKVLLEPLPISTKVPTA